MMILTMQSSDILRQRQESTWKMTVINLIKKYLSGNPCANVFDRRICSKRILHLSHKYFVNEHRQFKTRLVTDTTKVL